MGLGKRLKRIQAKVADKVLPKEMEEKPYLKTLAALSGIAPLMADKDVTGMRGSYKKDEWGKSVARVEERARTEPLEEAAAKAESAAAAAAIEEAAVKKAQESQRTALTRKGRRASILTGPQGASSPLGIPG